MIEFKKVVNCLENILVIFGANMNRVKQFLVQPVVRLNIIVIILMGSIAIYGHHRRKEIDIESNIYYCENNVMPDYVNNKWVCIQIQPAKLK